MKIVSDLSLENNTVILTWDYLVNNWSSEPVLVGTISGGDVYEYVLHSISRYRFVPTTYSSTQDCFYSDFNGTIVSNLICPRG